MKRRLVLAVLLLGASFLTTRVVAACGDKFLVIVRGTRFERPASRQTAAVLLYARPASDLTKTLIAVPVEAALRKAGYQASTVASEQELNDALANKPWDVVLADAHDLDVVRGRSMRRAAIIVPVVYGATSAELKQLKAQFPNVLRAPNRSQNFLDALDTALRNAPLSVKESE